MGERSIKLDCDCKCSVLCVDFDPEWDWSWDFYTRARYDGSWRHRLRIIWNLLRGQDHYFHGTIHKAPEMRRLRDFLNETLGKESEPIKLPLKPGEAIIFDFSTGKIQVGNPTWTAGSIVTRHLRRYTLWGQPPSTGSEDS